MDIPPPPDEPGHWRYCTTCNLWKLADEFRLRPTAYKKDGKIDFTDREWRCKECDKERQKANYNKRRQNVVAIMGARCGDCEYAYDDHKVFTFVPQLRNASTQWRAIFRIVEENPENWFFYYKLRCQNCRRSAKS